MEEEEPTEQQEAPPEEPTLPGLLEPHPLIPRATARKGTRRMVPDVRAAIGKQLSRDRAAELARSGDLDPAQCRVVWNVRGRPVTQPVAQITVPDLSDLQAVRRLGSFKGADSLIAMLPVERAGAVTMVELDSQLELHHGIQLLLTDRPIDLLAQPFLMVWPHDEGNLIHIPDLATIDDGQLRIYDVKPDHRAAEERHRRMFGLVDRTLQCGNVQFQVLGSMTQQRQINIARLGRYRWFTPSLDALAKAVHEREPATLGGVLRVVRDRLGLDHESGLPGPDSPSLVAIDVGCYALARDWAETDLNKPLGWASRLTWSPTTLTPRQDAPAGMAP